MGIFDFLWGSHSSAKMSVMCEDGIIAQRISKNIIYYSSSPTQADMGPRPSNPSSSSPFTSLSSTQSPSTSSPPFLPETATSHTDPPPSSPPESSIRPPSSDSPYILAPLSPSDSPVLPSSPLLPLSSPVRPLLLLFPWLGARPAGIAKYRDLYLGRGLDVLVVESNVWLFLWPRWALEYGAEVLQVLGDPRFTQRPLLVHASSIGGFTFTQLLMHMAQGPGELSHLARRVRGQVYDSMVVGSLEQMATGLGKTLFPRMEVLVRRLALGYFWLFKTHTADTYLNCIQVFYNSPVTSPALFFFCENDCLCNPVAMEAVIDHWRKRGVVVETRKWKESIHAGHLRCHPQEYLSMLETFVNSLSLDPLQAKM
ncbi:transmembrane protein 53-like isoform X2 [Osmerus mordax]|uniref:transmembrane protein 53-like isoform X2 n=1 Tax=Osmerus mordax TaxID=8014 RepID=UPI00350EF959